MPFSDVAEIAAFVMPGFLALKLVYAFGLKQRRTDLEWVVWSILLSALSLAFADWLIQVAALPPNPFRLGAAYGVAVAVALVLISIWKTQLLKSYRWRLVAEPWDMAYLTICDRQLQAVVELHDGREIYGDVLWMGLAGEGSAKSLTLGNVLISDASREWMKLPGDQELHIPEASVALLRLIPFKASTTSADEAVEVS